MAYWTRRTTTLVSHFFSTSSSPRLTRHYPTALWSNNLQDTDAGLFKLYQACVDAGSHVCPVYESTSGEIHARVHRLLASLKVKPISFYDAETGTYGIVDYATAKRTIFTVLFAPHALGKILLSALADLEQGHSQSLFQLSEMNVAQGLVTDACACPAAPRETWSVNTRENSLAIACGDGDVVTDDVDALREYYDKMAESSMFAETWWFRTGCR